MDTDKHTDITDWEQIALSSAQGAAALDVAFAGITFDGRYAYYSAINGNTHVRFDTTSAFTDITSWEQIALSSSQGAAGLDLAYNKVTFDKLEDELSLTSTKLKNRLHGQNNFRARDRWEQIAMNSATGHAALDSAYLYTEFDGRYVYMAGATAVTIIRYDTTARFRDITSWEHIAHSSAMGGALGGAVHNTGTRLLEVSSSCKSTNHLFSP